MATAQQQQAFVSAYGPYANQAGSRLGIPGNLVLAQWAQESGWGAGGGAASLGNMAGINYPGSTTGTNYQSYASPQAFTDSYVSTMQNPRYAGALQAGSGGNAPGFATALGQGGYYTGNQSVYANNVNANYSTINAMTGNGNSATALASNNTAGTTNSGFGSNSADNSAILDPTTGEPIGGGSTIGTGVGGASGTGGFDAQGNPIMAGQPGVLLDQPFAFGLTAGLAQATNSWITGAETAVGNWMTNALKSVFGSAINVTERGLLILLALVILAIALWKVMDPDGSKTAAVVRTAGEAAA